MSGIKSAIEAPLKRPTREAASHHLACRARDQLRSHSIQPVRDISVEVVGKSIVLRGKLNSFYQKQFAQEALKQIGGIDQ